MRRDVPPPFSFNISSLQEMKYSPMLTIHSEYLSFSNFAENSYGLFLFRLLHEVKSVNQDSLKRLSLFN